MLFIAVVILEFLAKHGTVYGSLSAPKSGRAAMLVCHHYKMFCHHYKMLRVINVALRPVTRAIYSVSVTRQLDWCRYPTRIGVMFT